MNRFRAWLAERKRTRLRARIDALDSLWFAATDNSSLQQLVGKTLEAMWARYKRASEEYVRAEARYLGVKL